VNNLEQFLQSHFQTNQPLDTYERVRIFISEILTSRKIGDLDLYSLTELFSIAQPFTKLQVDTQLRTLLTSIDGDGIKKSSKNFTGLQISNHVWADQILTKTIKQLSTINPDFRFWKKKYGLVISLNSKPIFRFESMTHYNHVYVYGTVVIYDIESKQDLQDKLPTFIKESDYKTTLRPTQRRGCIHKVTAAMFVKIVRQFNSQIQ
jgi:hypothetical protein